MATKTRTKRGRRRAPPRRSPRPRSSTATQPVTSNPPREVFTARELAALLGLNLKTVYQGAADGQIPSLRIGRRVVFPRKAIETWLTASVPTPARGILRRPSCSSPRKVTRT